MTHEVLRPLKGGRMTEVLRALGGRLDRCAASIDEVERGSLAEAAEVRMAAAASQTLLQQTHTQEIDALRTADDEASDAAWSDFDRRTLASLQTETSSVQQLQAALRKARDSLASKLDAEKTRLREHAESELTKLETAVETSRDQLARLRREADAVREEAADLLAKRHFDAAALLAAIPADPAASNPEPPSAESSYGAIRAEVQRAVEDARQRLEALRRSPASMFTSSWAMWPAAAAIGSLAAAGYYAVSNSGGTTRLLISYAVFGTVTILAALAAIFGTRPWLRSQLALRLRPMEDSCAAAERLIAVGLAQLQQTSTRRGAAIRQELAEKLRESQERAETELARRQAETNAAVQRAKAEQTSGRAAAHRGFEAALGRIADEEQTSLEAMRNRQGGERAAVRATAEQSLAAIDEERRSLTAWARSRVRAAVDQTAARVDEVREGIQRLCPAWPEDAAAVAQWHQPINRAGYLPLGRLRVRLGEQHDALLRTAQSAPLRADLPLVFQLVDQGSLLISADRGARPAAVDLLRNLLLRGFASVPPSRFRATVIDPAGLGRDWGFLMRLADWKPQLVGHRVWTQPAHLAQRLAELSHHTEDVIQQLLRDRYRDIREYNAEAGTLAEPLNLVLWSGFPHGLDEASWKHLTSLIESGGRCGVAVVLLVDRSQPLPPFVPPDYAEAFAVRLEASDVEGGRVRFTVAEEGLDRFEFAPDPPPAEPVIDALLRRVGEESLRADRVEVPFSQIVDPVELTYAESSAEGLTIPVGQAGVGRRQWVRLGQGTAQHVLVAGKTGSGKSSLLHTLITSAAARYAPDQLRLVLLDFKKGVEFAAYAESDLPHADIIGIESQREFGVAALEYLDRIMQRRGEAFRRAGVQDVTAWRAARPEEPMPRILMVVDEFQEIFSEDDKLAQQAAMLLDRIVRQGRSFGVHVVLASQTLAGNYSLPRTTLGQMAVRVALQCEGADAMMILGEDNLAAQRLVHPGQAIYNERAGRVEGNEPFQVAWLPQGEQRETLARLPAETGSRLSSDPLHGGLDRRVVFDGHRAARWDEGEAARELARLRASFPATRPVLLGESVAIEPAVGVPLRRQAGHNLLLVGGDDAAAAGVIRGVVESFSWTENGSSATSGTQPAAIHWVDASRAEDPHTRGLAKRLAGRLASLKLYAAAKADEAIAAANERVQERVAAAEVGGGPWPAELLVVTHLGRLRSLRRGDEFSFDDSAGPRPDKLLQEVLREGPAVGVHTLLWCDSAGTFQRWLPRSAADDFEYRLLMQMSGNDSNLLIDSAAANRLGPHVMLLYEESGGAYRKFRPYEA